MGVSLRRILTIAALLCGIGAWLVLRTVTPTGTVITALIVAAVVAVIPRTRDWIYHKLQRISRPSPYWRGWATVAVGVIAGVYLVFTALRQQRPLEPTFHDEQMFLIQTHMLARGRLWYPQHELADFFETFHVFVKPMYAPMHFPGTAMFNVPMVWLGWPNWVMPACAAALVVALTYRIVTELVDGVAGLLAALWMLSLDQFRFMSMTVRSQPVVMVFGLAMIWAWLHWRRKRSPAWAAVIGVMFGWAAITRPLEALCFALPVILSAAWRLRRAPGREWIANIAALSIGVAPFLTLQLIFNYGITGNLLKTPHQYYAQIYYPQGTFGLHGERHDVRPASDLPQKQLYYDWFVLPVLRSYQSNSIWRTWKAGRFPLIVKVTIPASVLIVLVPVGFLMMRTRGRWIVFSVLPLFLLFYAFFIFFIPEYSVAIAPLVALSALLGARAFAVAWPRYRAAITVAFATFIGILCVRNLPEFRPGLKDVLYIFRTMEDVNQQMPKHVRKPAVVLFTFGMTDSIHEEPVYNTDVAWPDDAPIIRAHDLGPRNVEIFNYYAKHQPERNFYLYDRAGKTLRYLGVARALGAGSATTKP